MCAQRLANSVGMLPTEDSPRSTNDRKGVPERLPEEILLVSKENLSGKSRSESSANASGTGQSSSSNSESWFDKARQVEE